MENCIVNKLKAVVDNPALPVLKDIVTKSWATNSVANQYIDLSSIFPLNNTYKINELKFEYELKKIKNEVQKYGQPIRGRSGITFLEINGAYQPLINGSTNYIITELSSAGNSVSITENTNTGTLTVNNEAKTWGYSGTISLRGDAAQTEFYLLDYDGKVSPETWAIGTFKLTHIPSNTILVDMFPAIVNGVNCFYDKISKSEFLPNTGTLSVE